MYLQSVVFTRGKVNNNVASASVYYIMLFKKELLSVTSIHSLSLLVDDFDVKRILRAKSVIRPNLKYMKIKQLGRCYIKMEILLVGRKRLTNQHKRIYLHMKQVQ